MKVLLVEDNRRLVASLTAGLGEEGLAVTAAGRGEEALAIAARGDADVVLLDLGLPDVDGLDVIRRLRAGGSHVPVLVLTARETVESRTAALDAGADDYLIKPFAFAELLARLRALARRAAAPRWAPLAVPGIAVEPDLTVRAAGRVIPLSPREHALLAYLLRRRGEVVGRPEILRDVFGYGFDPGTNLVDVHLGHLRRKLAGTPIAIATIRGTGIRLEVTP
ncbi:MAG TPA: response regulator transcription factor [Kofleriaceae bacterium]|nr:response regulator transcription factor [Kofleriaceae bacterium]